MCEQRKFMLINLPLKCPIIKAYAFNTFWDAASDFIHLLTYIPWKGYIQQERGSDGISCQQSLNDDVLNYICFYLSVRQSQRFVILPSNLFNMQVKRINLSPECKWFTEAQVPTTLQQHGLGITSLQQNWATTVIRQVGVHWTAQLSLTVKWESVPAHHDLASHTQTR